MRILGRILCHLGLHAWVPAGPGHATCIQPRCMAGKCLPECTSRWTR